MRERVYKTTRRTREQIEKEDKQFSNCFRCGIELEPIKVPRVQPTLCLYLFGLDDIIVDSIEPVALFTGVNHL